MKTALITGGNGGIGKEVAVALARNNYRIIIHGREPEKTLKAAAEIITRSGNNNVEYVVADISSVKGMKDLATAVKAKTDTIDSLTLSTGVIFPKLVTTPDGLESMFAIQYLSRFATVQLLLPELQKGNAKIAMVGASLIRGAKIFFDDVSLKNNFTMVRGMAQCMLANHLFVQEFAKRYNNSGMVMNIGHVGIAKTGIVRNSNVLFKMAVAMVGKPAETMAGNFIYMASSPDVSFSGYFLPKPNNTQKKVRLELNANDAARLWDMSLKLIK